MRRQQPLHHRARRPADFLPLTGVVEDGCAVTHEAFCQVLGYQETPSFVRAFRHWTGMPPASYRKSLTD